MKCIKVKDIANYMASLDFPTFDSEYVIVKDKDYVYTAKIEPTYDYMLMRCRPKQSLSGRRVMFDPRTISVPIPEGVVGERNNRPQMLYFDQATGRVNSRRANTSDVPQSVEEVTVNFETGTWATLDLECTDE